LAHNNLKLLTGTMEVSPSNQHVILLTDGSPTAYHASYQRSDASYVGGIAGLYSSAKDWATDEANRIRATGASIHPLYISNEYDSTSAWLRTLSGGDIYLTSQRDAMNDAFANIAKEIQEIADAWKVTSTLGQNFEFVNPDATQNGAKVTGNTVTWDLTQATKNNGKYELNYQIKLDTAVENFAEGTYALTNSATTLNYVFYNVDHNGHYVANSMEKPATLEAMSPAVNGEFPLVSYKYEFYQLDRDNMENIEDKSEYTLVEADSEIIVNEVKRNTLVSAPKDYEDKYAKSHFEFKFVPESMTLTGVNGPNDAVSPENVL